MRKSAVMACMLSVVMLTGCISIQVGTERNPSRLQMKGLATGFVGLKDIDRFSGKILNFGLLSKSEGPGELASLEVWPLFSVGVGVVGARVRMLPVQAGVGILFYQPEAKPIPGAAPCPPPPPPPPVVPPAPPPPVPPM